MSALKLRFDGFSGEWINTTLGVVSDKIQDGNYGEQYPKNNEFISKGVPFLTGKVLGKNGGINFKLINYISHEKHVELSKAHIRENDILFTNRGASVGAIGFVPKLLDGGNIGPQLTFIRVDESKILSVLLYQIMKTSYFQKQIANNDSGSAMKFFGIGSTKMFKINYPESLKEQQKIADFFTLLDRRIEQQQEKVEAWREYKKGMMQKLFSRELRFKDEDGEVFPEWTIVSLDSVSEINPKTEALKDFFQYIDLESVKAGQLLSALFVNKEDAPSRAQRVVREGDILYQTVRPYQKNNLFYNHNLEGQVVASTGYAQIKTNDRILNNSFLYQYLNTDRFTDNVLKKCTGTSYPAINSSDLGTIDIPLPCLKEQKCISALLSSMDNKVKIETAKLSTLGDQKEGLMQQMFI